MSKIVLITGASSGFGKIIAEKLSDEGYTVYGTSRNPNKYPSPKKYKLLKKQSSVIAWELFPHFFQKTLYPKNTALALY